MSDLPTTEPESPEEVLSSTTRLISLRLSLNLIERLKVLATSSGQRYQTGQLPAADFEAEDDLSDESFDDRLCSVTPERQLSSSLGVLQALATLRRK